MLRKVFLGIAVMLMLAFTSIIPAFASDPEGQGVKAEGTIQSVDTTAGSFTILTEDGSEVMMFAPEGFDITLLVVGEQVEAEGIAGPDGLIAALEIELQDGTEFEVDDDEAGEVEDDDDLDEEEDDDLDEDEDDEDDDDLDEDDDEDEDEGNDEGDEDSEGEGEDN